jgi:hypothetical protein
MGSHSLWTLQLGLASIKTAKIDFSAPGAVFVCGASQDVVDDDPAIRLGAKLGRPSHPPLPRSVEEKARVVLGQEIRIGLNLFDTIVDTIVFGTSGSSGSQ